MRTFLRGLRIVSAVTLFFFCWTYGPLYAAVAYAATGRKADVGRQRIDRKAQIAGQKPEERFEKALETIRKNIEKADEKAAKNEDVTAELAEVKAKKVEIESIDVQFRKEFAATEKKLKDSHLPKEILDRHYAFVKHYEDNMAKLRANLAAVEQGTKGKEFKEAIEKAKLQLEKTKPPRKHVPLDPNKLPFRAVKARERKPRLKKEDFEKEFKPRRTRRSPRTAFIGNEDAQESQDVDREWMQIASNGHRAADSRTQSSESKQQHILVASNGPLTGLLVGTENSTQDWPFPVPSVSSLANDMAFSNLTQNSELNTQKYMLAASTLDPPTADDLPETVEVQFTDAIKAKAAELGYNPVKIYEWVRNNIEYVPTYGSIQGADMCLQAQQCNDMDTASLLIALLRASNIPARYVYGTIEVPIDKITNWVGGFSDAQAALTLVASGGVPVAAGMSGGVITKARLEHVWVEANVAYGPYSGRPSNLNPDKIWVPLDPSYKQYIYTDGLDFQSAVPFDAQSFANQILSTTTTNTTDGSVTSVDSNYIQTTMTNYQTQVQNYISQNMPNATVGDIIGTKEIKKQKFGILPVTLPYKVITVGTKYSEVPDNLRQKVIFEIQDDSATTPSLSYRVDIPKIAGKRVTLSYAPATDADQQVINSYGRIFNTPAYLVNMKPQIKIEGSTVATGNSIGLGDQETFNMNFQSPSGTDDSVVSNYVTAGAYYGIGVDPSKITQAVIDTCRAKLDAVQSTVSDATIYMDDYIGELIYTTAMTYLYELDTLTDIIAKKYKIADLKHVSEAIVSKDLNVAYLYGIPTSVADGSMTIDVDRLIHSAVSQTADQTKEYQFTIVAGQMSSAMEHGIFEQMYQAKGVSTIQVLQLANSQGIPIYTITPNNMSAVLPQLQLSTDVITDIQNAVNAGKNVVIPKQNITYYGWTGTGYIVMDPSTGSGAYMISTSLAGGGQCLAAGGSSNNYCSIHGAIEFAHLVDIALEFIAAVMTPIALSFYISITFTGTIAAIFAAGLLIAGVIMMFFLINAYLQILANHAFNYNESKRRFYARRNFNRLS